MPESALTAMLIFYAVALAVAPLIGGAILRGVCRLIRIEPVTFLRCWMAYLAAWVAASIVCSLAYFALRSVLRTPALEAILILTVGIGLHLLIVPKVLRVGFARAAKAQGITLLVYTALVAVVTVPFVSAMRTQARQVQIGSNLHQVGQGFLQSMNNFNGRIIPEAIHDKDGKALLSWRVAILPYIDEQALYQRFKLDEPWDSPHNLALLPLMPAVFKPLGIGAEPGMTHLQVFVQTWPKEPAAGLSLTGLALFGPRFPFQPGGVFKPAPSAIRDLPPQTLLVVEAADAVPWTKPQDLPFGPELPLPKLGAQVKGRFAALFADGHHQWIALDLDESSLRALITADGDEPPVVLP